MSKSIELLSPAKNTVCGIEAVNHGADAVYIGAPKFSARAAAGNSIADIEELVNYAHRYNAKVYVALNTILKDEELDDVRSLIYRLYNIGTDALIIQDLGILGSEIPPIALHASTQTDNRTPEKVKFLEQVGFSQIVLARELSLEQINEIAKQTTAKLEFFVHGALCVSYSGKCYVSEAFCGRSANRGACAQYCRLPYDLEDSTGKIISSKKHLLSLKDLNNSENLEQLIDAGITSFKIEGRLKDVDYVKNITAYYRQKLDAVLSGKPDCQKASSGKCTYTFVPNPEKSFGRGFTDYFLTGRGIDITSFDTPKSMGEFIGTVKRSEQNFFTLSGKKILQNGDGLCYLTQTGEFSGFRVNKSEDGKIYPFNYRNLPVGARIYRNFDQEFDRCLSNKSSERKIGLTILLTEYTDGFVLSGRDEDGNFASLAFPSKKEPASKPQRENLINQLTKTGNTLFEAEDIMIDFSREWFIPASVSTTWRRQLLEKLSTVRKINYRREFRRKPIFDSNYPITKLTYTANVLNERARSFYRKHGVSLIEPAFESTHPKDVALMFTKHCIKYSMGMCPKGSKLKKIPDTTSYKEPFYLIHKNVKMQLVFDCKKCEMRIYKSNKL